MSQPELSIIIPALQEARRIERSLEILATYLKAHDEGDTEVLVVVADSPDGTAKLAQAKSRLFKNFRVIPAGPRQGKGHQVRIGMMEATGRYKLFMDADLATPLHHIENVRTQMANKADVIIAVRHLSDTHTGIRKFISGAGNWLVRLTLLPGIVDSQCGFKAFSHKAADELFTRQTIVGWGFDMEILAIARMQGYKIAQFDAPDWSDQPDGVFGDEINTAAIETLGELFTIIWRRTTGRYKHKHFTYEPYT